MYTPLTGWICGPSFRDMTTKEPLGGLVVVSKVSTVSLNQRINSFLS